jgi:hypothetical protein
MERPIIAHIQAPNPTSKARGRDATDKGGPARADRPARKWPFVRALGTAAIAGTATCVALSARVAPVAAFGPDHGELHLTKECSQWDGQAGQFCTFTASNLAAIPVGSRIVVDQAAGIPAGMLDSNVVIEAGPGDWAVGRCTLDLTTLIGLCNFTDGVGALRGFTARVNATFAGGVSFNYDGTYSFRQEPDRDDSRD